MIDSVLKGTGNSRFLKSSVPAGTSWADALAMLQAGTFPIDFNGINTEGFQQVGTPLNKANLLKDATAAQIGLPPSTTPDGMFQALGNTGELHVWERVTAPSYTLGPPMTTYLASGTSFGGRFVFAVVKYSDTVAVSVNGEVHHVNPYSDFYYFDNDSVAELQGVVRGKFVSVTGQAADGSGTVFTPQSGIWYIPNDAVFSIITGGTKPEYPYSINIVVDKMQKVEVSGLKQTDFPVSVDESAYTEIISTPGGYTIGPETARIIVTQYSANGSLGLTYGDSIFLNNSGGWEIKDSVTYSSGSIQKIANQLNANVLGKFFSFYVNSGSEYDNAFPPMLWYCPNGASFTNTGEYNGSISVDKIQPVTGYPATPAGTTIEYLGKLGDKAMVQVLSYVGTGTYGSSNPNSLTFDFVPKVVMIRCDGDTNIFDAIYGMREVITNFSSGYYVTVKWSKKTLSWYSDDSASEQMNYAGDKYYAIAIG